VVAGVFALFLPALADIQLASDFTALDDPGMKSAGI